MRPSPWQASSVIFCLFASIAFAESNRPANESDSSRVKQSDAAALVRQALLAEAEGKLDLRAELVSRALATDPNYPAAHWHAGEVQIDGKWLSADDAVRQTSAAGKVAAYRQLRDKMQNTLDGHLKLAKWCAEAGLKNEERAHLMLAVELQPLNKEAAGKLELVRFRGALMSRERREALQSEERNAEAAFKKWQPKLSKLFEDMNSDSASRSAAALKSLAEISDPAAIPALESTFGGTSNDVGLAAVAALASMREQPATDSLVRFAILSEDRDVRDAASAALKPRSLYAYAPMLIAALEMPVLTHVDRYELEDGRPIYRFTMFQEGPNANKKVVREGAGSEVFRIAARTQQVSREFRDPSADAAKAPDALRERNNALEQWNARIVATLRTATGVEGEASPMYWWKWWDAENEMFATYGKETYEDYKYTPAQAPTYTTGYTPYLPGRGNVVYDKPLPHRKYSCFVAGTPVWTSVGAKPIEEVKVGDMVLSQDAETGELAYKAVLATTVRPPSSLINIQCGTETISATRGHPFWVSGIGWQMAKELKAGQWLHTASGATSIDNVEEKGSDTCFNLVVADFGAYFVGKQKILVHDNNIRNATDRIVPGLAPAK